MDRLDEEKKKGKQFIGESDEFFLISIGNSHLDFFGNIEYHKLSGLLIHALEICKKRFDSSGTYTDVRRESG